MNDMTPIVQKNYVPETNPKFVMDPAHDDVFLVINSNKFVPTLITGPTGIGKTFNIEQMHAKANKALLRVNITIQEDEESLIGGLRLEQGSTFLKKGPVIEAMEVGATLLLDEIDLGSPTKLMCLQSVLEGAGYLMKRTGEYIKPKPGFNVIATANTKGMGDDSGNYIGTQLLNGAMLDRFAFLFDFNYPDEGIETEILKLHGSNNSKKLSEQQVALLIKWANNTRGKAASGEEFIQATISTRRLCDVVDAYEIFDNLDKAVALCLNRFDNVHRDSFIEIYNLLKDGKEVMTSQPDPDDVVKF